MAWNIKVVATMISIKSSASYMISNWRSGLWRSHENRLWYVIIFSSSLSPLWDDAQDQYSVDDNVITSEALYRMEMRVSHSSSMIETYIHVYRWEYFQMYNNRDLNKIISRKTIMDSCQDQAMQTCHDEAEVMWYET